MTTTANAAPHAPLVVTAAHHRLRVWIAIALTVAAVAVGALVASTYVNDPVHDVSMVGP